MLFFRACIQLDTCIWQIDHGSQLAAGVRVHMFTFFKHVAESVVWSLARATAQRNRSQFGRQSLLHKLLAAGSENVYVCVCARVDPVVLKSV